MAPSRKLAELFYEIRARTEGLDKDLTGAERSFGKLTDYVMKNPMKAFGAVGTALAAVAVKAAKMAEEVDRSMRRVEASTSGGAEGIRKLRTEIDALSIATGRSQAELAAAAAETSKSVKTMEEVGQRLGAALTLSQASGEDLREVLNGLDQVMDTFSISSDKAAQTVAQLYSAAKNRAPIADLFGVIQAAAPALVQMGIDLDTGARALAALIDQGLSAKQAGTEFKKLAELGAEGGERIRELAGDVPELSTAFEDLNRAAEAANNSTGNLIKRLGAGLAAPLIALGNTILPTLNKFLEANVTLVEALTGRYKNAADEAKRFAEASKGIPTGPNNPITITARGGLTADDIKRRQDAEKKAAEERKKLADIEKRQREDRLKAVNAALDKEVEARKKANAEILKAQRESARRLAEILGDSVTLTRIALEEEVQRLRDLGLPDEEIEKLTTSFRIANNNAIALAGALQKIELTPEDQKKLRDGLQAPKEELEEVESAALKTAQAISDIGNALLGMASALGIVDEQTESLARGAINIGAGATRIGGGDVLGGGLQLLGGVGDIIGGFRSRRDPETERAREEALQAQQELTEALDRVRDRIGDLIAFSSSGGDIAAVRNIPLTARSRTGGGVGGLEEIDFFRPIEDVLADLRKLGVGLDDLRQIAADAGVTLSESPTIAELQRLQEVLREIDFAAFFGTFEGQLSALEHRFELFGDAFDDASEQFEAFVDLLNDPKVGAPALFGAFEGMDTATSEGRDAIRALIQDLLQRALAGDIKPEELGGLSLERFLEALRRLNRQLDASADAADAAAEAHRAEARAQRDKIFADANRDIALRDIEDPLEQFGIEADAFRRAFPGIEEFMSQFDLTTVEGIEAFSAALPGFIAGIEDGSIVIEGLAEEDIPDFVDGLVGIESAGDRAIAAVRSFADALSEAFADIDLDAVIFGEDVQDTFNKKFSRLIAGLPAPPGTGGFTPGGEFDLSTQAGRDAARRALQDLAISNPELKPIIAELIRDLDSLPELVGDAVGGALGEALGGRGSTTLSGSLQTLTLFQGDRLITLAETQLLRQTQIRDLIASASSTRSQVIQPPSLSAIAGPVANFSTTSGGPSIVFAAGSVVVQAPQGTTDAAAFGEAFVASANRALADRITLDRFISGSTKVL